MFSGGDTELTTPDGAHIHQVAPLDAWTPSAPVATSAQLTPATSEADLASCTACYRDDASARTLSIALSTASETIHAGALSLTIDRAPSVKRYLVRVHY